MDIEALNIVAELATELETDGRYPLAAATAHELFLRMASAPEDDEAEGDETRGGETEHFA